MINFNTWQDFDDIYDIGIVNYLLKSHNNTYHMRKYVVFFIILYFAGSITASGFSTNEIEWAPAVEGTLHTGESLSNGPYSVKAIQFPSPVQGHKTLKGDIIPDTPVDPMIYLEVYKNGIFLKEVLLSMQSGVEIDTDYEVMISGIAFLPGNSKEWVQEYYNPWAKIAISLRGKPKVEVAISTEKSSYTSGSDQIITAMVTVKNNGEASAKNVDIALNINELKLRGGSPEQLHQVYIELKKGESKSFEVILLVPDLFDQKSYSLTADTKSFDVKELEYESKGSVSITVSPRQNFFTMNKAVSKNRIYLNDIIMVKLTIANSGAFDMNDINLNDSINPNFELISNTPLSWNIPVLRPGEWKDIEYSVKPLETSLNGFIFPSATAMFTTNNKQYNISSDAPAVIVNGPKIIINKTVDKQIVNIDDLVTVTVCIKNIGNIPTRIEAKDFLPQSVSLVNGSTSLDPTFLDMNSPRVFSYIIRPNREENIELPAAVANYTGVEFRGMTRSRVLSERPVITVIDPTMNISTPTPNATEIRSQVNDALSKIAESEIAHSENTPIPITPGFDIVFSIIILAFTTVFRRK